MAAKAQYLEGPDALPWSRLDAGLSTLDEPRRPAMSETTTAPATPAAPAPETPTPAPAATPPAPEQPTTTAPEWDGKVESLPEPVQKMIRDLRTESAERRTKLTAAEQAQQDAIRALAKAAGIDLPGQQDTAPDPAQLAEQLTATQVRARTAAVELAVYRAAGAHSGDPDALLDSRAFLAKVADLDPAAADFQTNVDTAIKDAVTANPKLKAVQATGASSVDHSAGGPGEGAPRTPKSLEDAIAARIGAR